MQRCARNYDKLPENGWARVNKYWMYNLYKDGNVVANEDSLPGSVGTIADCGPLIKGIQRYFFMLPLIWLGVLCANFWYISMWVGLSYGIAFTARMARRGQKLLKSHIEDKNAHTATDTAE